MAVVNPNLPSLVPPLRTPILQAQAKTGIQIIDSGLDKLPDFSKVLLTQGWANWFANVGNALSGGQGAIIEVGTHATRKTTTPIFAGQIFYETDRTVFYIAIPVSGTLTWTYMAGIMFCANLTDLPTDLSSSGPPDTGFLAWDEQFDHTYMWNIGGTWTFAPSDPGAGFIVASANNTITTPPWGGVWAPCDGNSHSISNGTGGTNNITLPNLNQSNLVFLAGSNSPTGVEAATSPTFETSPSQATTDVDTGAGQAVASGTGATVAAHTHKHNLDTLSIINPPSVGNGGLPQYAGFMWFCRQ